MFHSPVFDALHMCTFIIVRQALVAKKQKKAAPGKKGKRLGGVVKRAMKAEKSKKKKA